TSYLASEVRAGSIVFADYPVNSFDTSRDAYIDGIIGLDVFIDFILHIDFQRSQLSLDPRASRPSRGPPDPTRAGPLAGTLSRVVRLGDHLAISTIVN